MELAIRIGFYGAMIALAALLSLSLTEEARRLALGLGIVDKPAKRKVHSRATPYLGGVAIYLAFIIYGLFAKFFLGEFPLISEDFPEWFLAATLAGAIVVGVGVYDDAKGVSAWVKFPAQILAVSVIYWFTDLEISMIAHPFGGWIDFGPFTFLATIVWGVLLINAINLIDGLDGLAAGVVAISCVFLFIHDTLLGQTFHGVLILGLVGACVGFLRHNFAPARIFMGDAGAMFLGLMLAVFSMDQRVKGTTIVTLISPLLILGIPILDTSMAFLRRLSQGKHPFQGDARHIHHRFLALGLTDRDVVLVIYFFCIVLGLFALIITKLTPAYRFATISLLVLLILFTMLSIGYIERRFLEVLDEIRVYKEWMKYSDGNGAKKRDPACKMPSEAAVNGDGQQGGDDKIQYKPPAVSKTMMDKLFRAEEQNTERVLFFASKEWRGRLAKLATRLGHEPVPVDSLEEAEALLVDDQAGMAIVEVDRVTPEVTSFITNVRVKNAKATILVLADASNDPDIVDLLRIGAYSILPGCAAQETLEILLHNAVENRYLSRRLRLLNIVFWLLVLTIPIWIVLGRFVATGAFYY